MKRSTRAATATTRESLELKFSLLLSRFHELEHTVRQAGTLLAQVKEQVDGAVYERAPPYNVKKRGDR